MTPLIMALLVPVVLALHVFNTSQTLPPAVRPDGVSFAGVFTNHTVLQRAPQTSAVYGVVVSSACNLTNTLHVSLSLWKGRTSQWTLGAQHIDFINCSYVRWKASLPPMPSGGSFELHASAPAIFAGTGSQMLTDITFGDVWFCSGQSNMWLPVHYTFTRNATFEAVRKGKYRNIRMFTAPRNAQPDDAWPTYDLWVAPPPPPMGSYGASSGGGWQLPELGTYPCEYNSSAPEPGGTCGPARNGDEYFGNTIDMFSATCWYFGQGLQDLQEAAGEDITPLGLVHSAWGGTMVEMWQPNATLKAGECKNASGGSWDPSQLHRWDIAAAALCENRETRTHTPETT
jgi:hypothetical protein